MSDKWHAVVEAGRIFIIDGFLRKIASLDPLGRFNLSEGEAHAKMMAAAPEMAKTLQNVDAWLAGDGIQMESQLHTEVRAALAKAGVQ